MRTLPWLLLLPFTACADDRIELEDVGRACIVPESAEYDWIELPELTFDYAQGPHVLDAVIDECALSCARDLDMGCEVTQAGNVLTIHVWASYADPGGSCDASCRQLRVQCEVGDLSQGSYSVEMGATSATLEIPSTSTTVCVEQFTG